MPKKKIKASTTRKTVSKNKGFFAKHRNLTWLLPLLLIATACFLFFKNGNITKQDSYKEYDEIVSQDDDWNAYTNIDNTYTIKYPKDWYTYEYPQLFESDTQRCTAISDIENPVDIPAKVAPENHSLIKICHQLGEMPTTFNAGNGVEENPSIHEVTINGYPGIRGNTSSTIGTADLIYLKKSDNEFIYIMLETGDQTIFDKMLQSFKFAD